MSGLPEPEQLAQEQPDLDIYDDTKVDAERQIELARRAESAAMATDERIANSEGRGFRFFMGSRRARKQPRVCGEYRSSSYSLAVSPVAVDPASGTMQRDAWYDVQRKFIKLETPEAIGIEAAKRTVRRLGARKIATKRVPSYSIAKPLAACSVISVVPRLGTACTRVHRILRGSWDNRWRRTGSRSLTMAA